MSLMAVFLVGIPIILFLLMAPHVFETWRRAIAPIAVAGALIALEAVMARVPPVHAARLSRGLRARLLTSTIMGALLGLLWGAVAGDVPLLSAISMGVWFALFFRGLDELSRVLQRRRASVSAEDSSTTPPTV